MLSIYRQSSHKVPFLSNTSDIARSLFQAVEPKAGTWVKLLELPSSFSFDQALLLCRTAETWVAWVPEHGEIQLHESQFETI